LLTEGISEGYICKREGFGQGERKYFSPLVFRIIPLRKGVQRVPNEVRNERHRGKPKVFPLKFKALSIREGFK